MTSPLVKTLFYIFSEKFSCVFNNKILYFSSGFYSYDFYFLFVETDFKCCIFFFLFFNLSFLILRYYFSYEFTISFLILSNYNIFIKTLINLLYFSIIYIFSFKLNFNIFIRFVFRISSIIYIVLRTISYPKIFEC